MHLKELFFTQGLIFSSFFSNHKPAQDERIEVFFVYIGKIPRAMHICILHFYRNIKGSAEKKSIKLKSY